MDSKVACLLLLILGVVIAQGAVSENKRMNPLHARQNEGFCADKEDGNYPNNCLGYISCSNGNTYYMPCPDDLTYNQETDQCD